MTDSSLFTFRRLGDLAEVFDGPHATPRKVDTGPWFLNIASLKNGRLDLSESTHIHRDDVAKWSRRVTPQRGDTLFSYETRIGQAAMWDRDDEAVLGRRMGLLRPRPGLVHPRFLTYAYLAQQFQEVIRLGTLHGATVDRIPIGKMPDWRIATPPLVEQERIAGVLGGFDDLIETNRRVMGNLESLIHGLFAQERFDEPPSGGGAVALRELIAINPKIAKPKGDAPYVDMAMLPTDAALLGPPLVRPAAGGAKFQNGDTLLARITPCLENGKTAYVSNLDGRSVAVGSTEFIVLRGSGDLAGIWTYALARSPRFRAFAIQQLGDGTSGRQRLSADAVGVYRVSRPSDGALTRFRESTEPLVEAMTGLHAEVLDLARQRDELLPLLMSGKVRVRDVEESVS